MLYIAFVCIFLSIFLFTYNKNHLSKKKKIFYDLTLYLKFERPLLKYFNTTPLIISKKWQTFSPSNISLCLED